MLDKTTVIDMVERYADLVKKELSPAFIVLYGSYVNGTPHEDSDIDVAIIFNGFSGDWLKTSAWLWGLTELKQVKLFIRQNNQTCTHSTAQFFHNISETSAIKRLLRNFFTGVI